MKTLVALLIIGGSLQIESCATGKTSVEKFHTRSVEYTHLDNGKFPETKRVVWDSVHYSFWIQLPK